ncbi:MAG: M20/M25/M40 family metallo-hydrolase [Emergencia sp.]|nr:M20/M25/M40 family metallo-hydrolase [Emergencia sp.]
MNYLEKNREKLIDDLIGCLSIASVSEDKEAVAEGLDYVLSLAESMGMNAKKVLDGQVGVVEIGEGDETLGILTHIDVVSSGDRDLWICDPFQGQVIDDKIYGRGALDDKGPLIACLHAMKAAMEEERPFQKKVQMIIGTQEEVEWTDMESYVKTYPLPDYGFTPDGEFPVCNIEKGGVDAVLRFPMTEESAQDGLFLKSICGGTAVNIVPGECTAVLSDGSEIKVQGKAVHSSRPEKGKNAVLIMAEKLAAMDLADNGLLRIMKMIRRRLSDIYGGDIELTCESEYYNGEFIHKNVISPTMIETGEDYLQLTLNVRFSYEFTEEKVVEAITNFCREEGGTVIEALSLPAVYVSREEPFLEVLAEAYESETGLKNEFALAYGGSYAKAMPKMVSWGPILPDMEDTCHEENEYIAIEDYFMNFRVYHRAILGIAKSKKHFL